jgi:phosphonate transport system permease protein
MTETTASASLIRDEYAAQMKHKRLLSGIMLIIFVALLVSGFRLADQRNAGGFVDGILHVFDFPSEVLTEAGQKITDFPALFLKYLPSMLETINIAGASTLIGYLIALILSMLSTRGLARWPRAIPLFRRTMDIMRAMPEIVIALVLIFILGGGPVPAMIAIAFHTSGALGKLFSEVNENVDLKPVEGLSSVGASWVQKMWLAVVPQVLPNYLSYALLRFEINIRASAILGFVGAGGIGYDLKNAISWGQGRYDDASAIFLILFLTILLVDQASSVLRNRLIGRA